MVAATIDVLPPADAASLHALSSLNEASASLEATLAQSQTALQEQHMHRMQLQEEVDSLRDCAETLPLLEHEVLAQGERADGLEDALGRVVARNEALQVFAHLRVRARSSLQGAEALCCVASCLADMSLQRAFCLWRWNPGDGLPPKRALAEGAPGASDPVKLRSELRSAEARIEELARRDAALAYDNMLLQRTQALAASQARRGAAASALLVWWRSRQVWLLGGAWRRWLSLAWAEMERGS